MAEQMEIHPGRNGVINAAESTFLRQTGKSTLCGISFYSNERTRKEPRPDEQCSRFSRFRQTRGSLIDSNLPKCPVCAKCPSCPGDIQPTAGATFTLLSIHWRQPGRDGASAALVTKANPISVLITNDELMALMPLAREPTPKST